MPRAKVASDSALDADRLRDPVKTVVAITGRPNTGKTTLFNALTGLNQRVANFAGCTVERAVGSLGTAEDAVEIVDLPGTHSLAAISQDEKIAFDFLEKAAKGGLHVLC